MRLPEIAGKNKIRDAAIVVDFKHNDMDFKELAEKYKLCERRIMQILAKNHAFIKVDKEWEKQKRINRLRRLIKNKTETSKDVVDVIEQIRKEIEGDGKNVDIKPIIQIVNYEDTNSSRGLQTQSIRIRDFGEQQEVQEHQMASSGEKDNAGHQQTNS